jgi:phosphatidate cytidylyltransferase
VDERDEPNERDTQSERPPAEGVRIIGAEGAQAALERGQAAGRRAEDELRYGDVPPAPTGPRPPHRFPLPASADPATAVPRPPVIPPEPPTRGAAPPAEGFNVTTGPSPELPHWTEPATGEVPRILAGGSGGDDDDLAVWSGVTPRTPRWRDQQSDWAEGDFDDVNELADPERVGVLDPTRSEHSDLYTFDDPAPTDRRGEGGGGQPPTTISSSPRGSRPDASGALNGGRRDMGTAIAVGTGILVLALLMFSLGPVWALVFSTAVVLFCALELYNVFQRAGYRPATLLGATATVSLMFGAYWKQEIALPLVLVMSVVVSMLWYMIGVVRARPTVNVAVTMLGLVWVGTFGSYAALLLKDHGHHPNNGVGLLWGAVLTTVAYDVVGFVVGSRIGRTPLAPEISPNKTWEGFISGAIAAAIVGGVLVGRIHPWHAGSGLKLGLLVGFFVAPLGDLCESMIKRDIGVKDMGSMLPGHGGMLDRFDALLFVLPATFYLAQYLRLG